MRITALAGGVGGARFLRGLRAAVAGADVELTIIGNTGDDITLYGLRVCPDLDTLMYTLGGGVDVDQGWGRADETHVVQGELSAYGAVPDWFSLGDRDLAAHIARSQWLGQGLTLSQITARLAARWGLSEPQLRLLPMSDQPIETHVVIDQGEGPTAVHFQEWWVRLRAAVPAQRFAIVGLDRAQAAPGVVAAIAEADLVLLPPSNPVVSIGVILGVPGIRTALCDTKAPVVGVSPLIHGRPVRGHADACLAAIGVECTSAGVAELYRDFLDGWLVDPADQFDPADPQRAWASDLTVRARDIRMDTPELTRDLAAACLDLGQELAAARRRDA